ncbi:MAG: helix-turn-helix transcriptional regulator [Bacteroidota bacterium]
MAIFLKVILEEEGIKQSELSRESGISTTTINKICTRNLGGTSVSPTTKGKLVKSLNKLVGKEKYKATGINFG